MPKGLSRDCPRCGAAVAARAAACGACGAALGRVRSALRRPARTVEAGPRPGPGEVDEGVEWAEERLHLEDDEYEAFLAREFGAGERGRGLRRRALTSRLVLGALVVLLVVWALLR